MALSSAPVAASATPLDDTSQQALLLQSLKGKEPSISSSAETHAQQRQSKHHEKEQKKEQPVDRCWNCKTVDATRFRNVKLPYLKASEMARMCNACANYYWMKGEMRPQHLWNLSRPRKRKRRTQKKPASAAQNRNTSLHSSAEEDDNDDQSENGSFHLRETRETKSQKVEENGNAFEPIASRIKIRLLRRRNQKLDMSEMATVEELDDYEDDEEGGTAEEQQRHHHRPPPQDEEDEDETGSEELDHLWHPNSDNTQDNSTDIPERKKPLHEWTLQELQEFLSLFSTPTSVNNPHDLVARENITGALMYDMIMSFDTTTMAKALKIDLLKYMKIYLRLKDYL